MNMELEVTFHEMNIMVIIEEGFFLKMALRIALFASQEGDKTRVSPSQLSN